MNRNIRRLGIFFLLAFAIILGDLTYWQIIDASNMQARQDNGRTHIAAAEVRRGQIYDRNGVLLAARTENSDGSFGRTYTDPSLSQTIGYDSPIYGKTELEQTYDSYLSGQEVGHNWQTFLNQLEHKPVTGDSITLTIDDRLQRAVAAIMPEAPSAAIVADPRTGEILAAVSKPSFDANQINDHTYWTSLLQNPGDPLINRPFNGYYPPGSTFKVVTLSAALDSGIMNLDTTFSGLQATGPLTVGYHTFPATINNLPAGVDTVTLQQALEFSDNIVFAQVGLALGIQRFLDYAHAFGLDHDIPFSIPVSASHVRTPGETFDQLELASSAFGQGGLHVTPLQMLMVAEAVANGGAVPAPQLVKQVTAPNGEVIQSEHTGTLFQPMSQQTAAQVRDAMVGVVNEGSGFEAKIPGVEVAAKTGTAETGEGRPPHAWFICFAPADHPRVAVAVIVEHGGEGAFVAAPLAKQILEAALPLTSP